MCRLRNKLCGTFSKCQVWRIQGSQRVGLVTDPAFVMSTMRDDDAIERRYCVEKRVKASFEYFKYMTLREGTLRRRIDIHKDGRGTRTRQQLTYSEHGQRPS